MLPARQRVGRRLAQEVCFAGFDRFEPVGRGDGDVDDAQFCEIELRREVSRDRPAEIDDESGRLAVGVLEREWRSVVANREADRLVLTQFVDGSPRSRCETERGESRSNRESPKTSAN